MALDDPDNPLAVEIQQEKAYFAACRKMVDSLQALERFDETADDFCALREDQARRRSDLIDHAAERVFFVIIQREAMKLSWYEEFFEDYDIPPEVRARVGHPRR